MTEHKNAPTRARSDVDGGRERERARTTERARVGSFCCSRRGGMWARWGVVMVKGKGRGRAEHPKHAHMGVLWLFSAMSGEGGA